MSLNPAFICPLCQHPLIQTGQSLKCVNQHNFDFAREGYVNLLPVQKKKTRQPGDNAEMVTARRNFLDRGYYNFLLIELRKIVAQSITHLQTPAVILDSGCAEGYFTHQILSQYCQQHYCYGMDISKYAVKFAARYRDGIRWFVATMTDIPLPSNSLDIVLKINAPLDYAKVAQKLKSNGLIISVTPGSSHLIQLKALIYQDVRKHLPEATPEGYRLVEQYSVSEVLKIHNNNEIGQLFKMTPFYWKTTTNNREKIAQLTQLEVDAAFSIKLWQPAGS